MPVYVAAPVSSTVVRGQQEISWLPLVGLSYPKRGYGRHVRAVPYLRRHVNDEIMLFWNPQLLSKAFEMSFGVETRLSHRLQVLPSSLFKAALLYAQVYLLDSMATMMWS